MFVHDEEDGKNIAINFAPGNRGEVILTMKDGSNHALPTDMARVLPGLCHHWYDPKEERKKMIEGLELIRLVTCTLNAPGLPAVTYNVTQLTADAGAGRFGLPQVGHYDQLETLAPHDEWRNLEQPKVLSMMQCFRQGTKVPSPFPPHRLSHIIDIPMIAVVLALGPTVHAVTPVDGNHRGKARQLLGAKTFQRFVVPEAIEREYRLQVMEFPNNVS